jgi:hypothetical protein
MTTQTPEPSPGPEPQPPAPSASLVELLAMRGGEDIDFEPVPMSIGLRAAEFD